MHGDLVADEFQIEAIAIGQAKRYWALECMSKLPAIHKKKRP